LCRRAMPRPVLHRRRVGANDAKAGTLHGLDAVKRNAADAPVDDLTDRANPAASGANLPSGPPPRWTWRRTLQHARTSVCCYQRGGRTVHCGRLPVEACCAPGLVIQGGQVRRQDSPSCDDGSSRGTVRRADAVCLRNVPAGFPRYAQASSPDHAAGRGNSPGSPPAVTHPDEPWGPSTGPRDEQRRDREEGAQSHPKVTGSQVVPPSRVVQIVRWPRTQANVQACGNGTPRESGRDQAP